jgi:hypothetical protein
VPAFKSGIVIMETPPSETMSPFMSTPFPRMAMSWPVDCGFFERMTTGPADAVAVDFTKVSPLAATSISITCPPAALETADVAEDAADDNADEMPPAEGTRFEEVPPSDDPQPTPLTSTIAAAVATIRLQNERSGITDRIPEGSCRYTSSTNSRAEGWQPNHPAQTLPNPSFRIRLRGSSTACARRWPGTAAQ